MESEDKPGVLSIRSRLRDAAVVRRMPAWGIEDLIEIITNMHPEVDPAQV